MRPLVRACESSLFGQLLEAHWFRRGLSQQQFCRAINRSPAYVGRVRRGERHPPYEDLDRWAQILELQGDDLLVFWDAADLCRTPKRIVLKLRLALLAPKAICQNTR